MKRAMIVVGLALAGASSARAQTFTDSTLADAVRLVSEGQGDSARALVRALLARVPRTDSLYPEVLFVSGMVAENLDSALTTFRRVSIEYSQSPWADDALLRIAQLSFAARDFASVRAATDRLLSDYPFSELRGAAAYWAARGRLEEGKPDEACPYLRQAVNEAGADVELLNRARYYLQRCQTPGPPDTIRAQAPPPPPSSGPVYAVQVAAVGTAQAADDLMRQLSAAGFQSRVVRDTDGLFKVRVGRYQTRAEAQALQAELKSKVGGSPFVVEEQR
jgi:tetratricopeptide (TPR) repeat protein